MATVRPSLDASHFYCHQLARRTARNFYYSFLGLPRARFQGMCALYAFMRLTDDLGDEPGLTLEERRHRLDHWEQDLRSAPEYRSAHPVWPALEETIQRFQIPVSNLVDVIDGVRMDLEPVRMETFADLQTYCYHVAGAVGLCCLRIWEVDAPEAGPLAIDCGLAFQLTNILRDLKEDADVGRIYLPQEDLERFHYEPEDLIAGRCNIHFMELMRFEVSRARAYYQSAARLPQYLSAETRPVLGTMLRIYSGLLDKIEHRRFDVFSERVRLSTWFKFRTVATELVRARMPL